MNIKAGHFILTAVLMLVSVSGQAAGYLRPEELIAKALKHDPAVRNILNDTEQNVFAIDAGLPSGALILQSEVENGFDLDGDDPTHTMTTSVTKPFVAIGSELTANHNVINTSFGRGNTVGVFYKQHLVKNFLGRDYRLKENALTLTNEVRNLTVTEEVESYIEGLLLNYLDFSHSYHSLTAIRRRYQASLKLKANIEAKRASNIALEIDVIRSSQQVIERQLELERLKYELDRVERTLSDVTGAPLGDLVPPPLLAIDKVLAQKPSGATAPLASLRARRILALREEAAKMEYALAANADDPELALMAGAQSEDATRYGTSANRTEALFGLTFSMIIGTDSQLAAQKQQAAFNRGEVGAETADFLASQARKTKDAVALFNQTAHLARLLQMKRANVRKIAQEEQKRFERGRIDLETLITAQDAVTSTELDFIEQHVALLKALVVLASLEDRLFDSKTVSIPWAAAKP